MLDSYVVKYLSKSHMVHPETIDKTRNDSLWDFNAKLWPLVSAVAQN